MAAILTQTKMNLLFVCIVGLVLWAVDPQLAGLWMSVGLTMVGIHACIEETFHGGLRIQLHMKN